MTQRMLETATDGSTRHPQFAGAAVLEVLAVLFVLPLFWGWWTLGHAPLVSPVELALAFDAPLFKKANSATGSTGVIKKLGEVHVTYGAAYETSLRPSADDAETKYAENIAPRLGIGRSKDVMAPYKCMRFDV